jgi:hypothetical protein
MMHKSQVNKKTEVLEYWRNPTKAEIKFGYGATHYRNFDFDDCFDTEGYLKLKVRASDDNLIYYFETIVYTAEKKGPINKI